MRWLWYHSNNLFENSLSRCYQEMTLKENFDWLVANINVTLAQCHARRLNLQQFLFCLIILSILMRLAFRAVEIDRVMFLKSFMQSFKRQLTYLKLISLNISSNQLNISLINLLYISLCGISYNKINNVI